MPKKRFNPAYPAHVVVVPVKRMTARNLDRAVKKLSEFFMVDNDLEHVIRIAEWYNYELGNSDKYVFCVDMESEYHRISMTEPSSFELFIETENEENTVVVL